MKRSIIPIFIPHLGCPNNCVFCNQRQIACEKEPQPYEVSQIIESALEYAENPQISFYGGSFTAIPRQAMLGYLEAAYPFVAAGQCDSIRLSTRPDAIDEEVLDILGRYGVRTIEIGAQSMEDSVLEASGRGHSSSDTQRASHLIKEHGFELILQMMVGLPKSTAEDEKRTAVAISALKPDGVRIYPTCVIENTPLYEMYKTGRYKALTVEKSVDICADLLEIFDQNHIPVVRLGLNPTEELSGGAVKAGAYHPSLGEMVYSKRFLKKILPLIPRDRPYDIVVQPKMLSVAIGQKKSNLVYLKSISRLCRIIAEEGLLKPFEIRVKA
ncbi:MAG: radical SAM protein [Clostridiaceae bacterium]|nr:radical SAM protein [Clostridiaceae bacterium]